MSSDRNAGEQFALSILIVVLLGLACSWFAGCASAAPARPAVAPVERELGPMDVTLRAFPPIVLWGGAVRLTCHVPQAWDYRGAVRLALEGVRVTTAQLPNAVSHSILIEHLPCGKNLATCTVVRVGLPDVRREVDVEVKGGMCDGGGA